jgi:hypothetical protein
MALRRLPVRAPVLREKSPRHSKSTSPFGGVSAMKGPRNVASGNARRVPDSRPGPHSEGVAGLPPRGCDPFGVGHFPGASDPWASPAAGLCIPCGDERVESARQPVFSFVLSIGFSPCRSVSVAQASGGVTSKAGMSFRFMGSCLRILVRSRIQIGDWRRRRVQGIVTREENTQDAIPKVRSTAGRNRMRIERVAG